MDYLLKPVDDAHLSRALQRARDQQRRKSAFGDKQRLLTVIGDITGRRPAEMEQWLKDGAPAPETYPEKIAIRDNGNITLVPAADIDWVDAAGDYMCLHVNGSIHVMRITLKELEAQLDPSLFQRIHRSTVVNMNRVQKICAHINGEYHLMLDCGARLKMSRTYKDRIQHFL